MQGALTSYKKSFLSANFAENTFKEGKEILDFIAIQLATIAKLVAIAFL